MKQIKIKVILGISFLFTFSLFISKANAVEVDSVFLDDATVEKGYTVINSDNQFKLGLPAQAVAEGVLVQTEEITDYPAFPKNTNSVSAVYHYQLTGEENLTLNSGLNLAVVLNSTNNNPKQIYYNSEGTSWIPITTVVSLPEQMAKGTLSLTSAKIVVLEQAAYRITLDEATLQKGYTVANPENQNTKVGIFPETINQKTTVVLKPAAIDAEVPEGLAVVSDCYSFEFKTEAPLEFKRPIVISMLLSQSDDHRKQVYYYDGNKESWIPLPSQTVSSNEVRALIHLSYAKIVVLKDNRFMEEGSASWYCSSRNPFGAASNDYPYDTILKVTNLANQQSVEVKIVSTGPFVQGRIIDLANRAFAAIANLYLDGVIMVRVEPVL